MSSFFCYSYLHYFLKILYFWSDKFAWVITGSPLLIVSSDSAVSDNRSFQDPPKILSMQNFIIKSSVNTIFRTCSSYCGPLLTWVLPNPKNRANAGLPAVLFQSLIKVYNNKERKLYMQYDMACITLPSTSISDSGVLIHGCSLIGNGCHEQILFKSECVNQIVKFKGKYCHKNLLKRQQIV